MFYVVSDTLDGPMLFEFEERKATEKFIVNEVNEQFKITLIVEGTRLYIGETTKIRSVQLVDEQPPSKVIDLSVTGVNEKDELVSKLEQLRKEETATRDQLNRLG